MPNPYINRLIEPDEPKRVSAEPGCSEKRGPVLFSFKTASKITGQADKKRLWKRG